MAKIDNPLTVVQAGGENEFMIAPASGMIYQKRMIIAESNAGYPVTRDGFDGVGSGIDYFECNAPLKGDLWAMFARCTVRDGIYLKKPRSGGSIGAVYFFDSTNSSTIQLGSIGYPILSVASSTCNYNTRGNFVIYVDATTLAEIPDSVMNNISSRFLTKTYKNSTTGEVITE